MIRSASQVIRKDLPYITCQVCKIAMGEVWDIAEQMRKDAPYNRVDEGEFQELTQQMIKMGDSPGSDNGTGTDAAWSINFEGTRSS